MTHLTTLYLNGCDVRHVPRFSQLKRRRKRQTSWLPKKMKKPNKTSSGLGSLTSLYVQNSEISMKTLLHILSNCPLLKTMTLKTHEFYDLDGITVTNLFESLKVIKNLTIWREIIEDLPVNTNDRSIPQQVPVTLVHLKSLCIEDISLDVDGLQIIALFIRSSPNLEKLTIMTDSRDEEVPCSRSMEVYSDIRLEHLRELEIINLSSTQIELYIVKLILMRSPILKKLRIHIAEGYKVDEILRAACGDITNQGRSFSKLVEKMLEYDDYDVGVKKASNYYSSLSLMDLINLAIL
ncbi:F-box/FBD/LRR-repeat protein [Tanacetum coccineum]